MSFSKQNEYRVMFTHDESEYVDFQLGDLFDIANRYPIVEFEQIIENLHITHSCADSDK